MMPARQQVDDFGVDRHQGEAVTEVEAAGDGFTMTTEEGEYDAEYVVLATGANRDLAESLSCEFDDDDTVSVDLSTETSVDGVYATGAMARAEEWQAVISAGDGAAAALDILSNEKGEHYHDFDIPDTAASVFGDLIDDGA